MKCPKCGSKGEVEVVGLFCLRPDDGCDSARLLLCPDCFGTGEVDDRVTEWKVAGAAMRAERLARGMTLRAEAARRGITASELSRMERGLVEPKGGVE